MTWRQYQPPAELCLEPRGKISYGKLSGWRYLAHCERQEPLPADPFMKPVLERTRARLTQRDDGQLKLLRLTGNVLALLVLAVEWCGRLGYNSTSASSKQVPKAPVCAVSH